MLVAAVVILVPIVVYVIAAPSAAKWFLLMMNEIDDASSLWKFVGVFFTGIICGLLVVPILSKCLAYIMSWFIGGRASSPTFASHNQTGDDSRVYGLGHSILNIELPPKTMWMNMGYWIDENNLHFPSACQALLEQVLQAAGLLQSDQVFTESEHRSIRLLDLGFGCGDQTIYLTQPQRHMGAGAPKQVSSTAPLVDHYVGVTLNKKQFDCAHRRVTSLGLANNQTSANKENYQRMQLFCANAAQPDLWSKDLQAATSSLSRWRSSSTPSLSEVQPKLETWVLALDTLYHFSPSRQPILTHTFTNLDASMAAFDLLLADETSRIQQAFLRVFAGLTGTPWGNFITVAQYRAQLVAAGFKAEDVVIQDISDKVFAPLAAFLGEQNSRLRDVGFGGIGAFHVMRWILAWWAKSGVVRGCIIVARKPKRGRV